MAAPAPVRPQPRAIQRNSTIKSDDTCHSDQTTSTVFSSVSTPSTAPTSAHSAPQPQERPLPPLPPATPTKPKHRSPKPLSPIDPRHIFYPGPPSSPTRRATINTSGIDLRNKAYRRSRTHILESASLSSWKMEFRGVNKLVRWVSSSLQSEPEDDDKVTSRSSSPRKRTWSSTTLSRTLSSLAVSRSKSHRPRISFDDEVPPPLPPKSSAHLAPPSQSYQGDSDQGSSSSSKPRHKRTFSLPSDDEDEEVAAPTPPPKTSRSLKHAFSFGSCFDPPPPQQSLENKTLPATPPTPPTKIDFLKRTLSFNSRLSTLPALQTRSTQKSRKSAPLPAFPPSPETSTPPPVSNVPRFTRPTLPTRPSRRWTITIADDVEFVRKWDSQYKHDGGIEDMEKRAMLCVREIIRTERSYQRYLIKVWEGVEGDQPPPLFLAHLPSLIHASLSLSLLLSHDPTTFGVSLAFVSAQQDLEEALVGWCSVAGEVVKSAVGSYTLKTGPSGKRNSYGGYGRVRGEGGGRGLRVQDVIVMPSQRIGRYVLLYKDLLAHTPTPGPARALVEKALEGAERIAEMCDRAQRHSAFSFIR